jgi:hypothetical protein
MSLDFIGYYEMAGIEGISAIEKIAAIVMLAGIERR